MSMEWRRIYSDIRFSEKVNAISDAAFRLYQYLLVSADDYGRLQGETSHIKLAVCPAQDWPLERVEELLSELAGIGLIERYSITERPEKTFIHLARFEEHQPPGMGRRRIQSRIPPFNTILHSVTLPRTISHYDTLDNTKQHCITLQDKKRKEEEKNKTEATSVASSASCASADSPKPINDVDNPLLILLSKTDPFNKFDWSDKSRRRWESSVLAAFPMLDMGEEILKAAAWLIANPRRHPTAKGAPNFLRSWFDRANERRRKSEPTHKADSLADALIAAWPVASKAFRANGPAIDCLAIPEAVKALCAKRQTDIINACADFSGDQWKLERRLRDIAKEES